MLHRAVYVTGLGVVSPAGADLASLRQALDASRPCFSRREEFAPQGARAKPVGWAASLPEGDLSRTHRLALCAARQALAAGGPPPEAIVLGVCTGGMPASERYLVAEEAHPRLLAHHATGDIAWTLAREFSVEGPALTVSTACSSAAVALKLALEMLRRGACSRLLAGGADGVCAMTHFGFDLLKLVDPEGARPLDAGRAGMTVSEAGAMLLLEAVDAAKPPPEGALAILGGAGLSCDAHHATAPHPEGDGALAAMKAALADAGLRPEQVDYINLHGTGTPDNDRSEAKAVRRLFSSGAPRLSSTKGVTGHPLAAAGALESVVAIDALSRQRAPANAGLRQVDPDLNLEPLRDGAAGPLRHVLSNSFGFGGNNASLLWSRIDAGGLSSPARPDGLPWLYVRRAEALTGAGFVTVSLDRLLAGESCVGSYDGEDLLEGVPPRARRRLKRMGKMALALEARLKPEGSEVSPERIYFGTGWGALGETHDFLKRLFASPERFSSPTDFVGSVHNAPAGMLALRQGARGDNVTMTGGAVSFPQALLAASLLLPAEDESESWLFGQDEGHAVLSPRLDDSVATGASVMSDGAGALAVQTKVRDDLPRLRLLGMAPGNEAGLRAARTWLTREPMIWLDVPAAETELARGQAEGLGLEGPRWSLRRSLGEHASVSAAACALAIHGLKRGQSPGDAGPVELGPAGIVVLSLGRQVAAVHILPPLADRAEDV